MAVESLLSFALHIGGSRIALNVDCAGLEQTDAVGAMRIT
jgi:hypothetical protein